MIGVITARDILAHPVITIQCFGWGVFLRALFVGQHQTFLSLLPKAKAVEGAMSRLSTLVEQCINLELRSKRVYVAFARAFADQPNAREFFETLAQQEQDHADLLMLCKQAALRSGWIGGGYNPWEDYVPCLEEHMQEVEKTLYEVGSLHDALRLVVQIESAEINRVFQSVLAACDSVFVKRLEAFHRATEEHISYIARELPELDARFTLASRELRALFPWKS